MANKRLTKCLPLAYHWLTSVVKYLCFGCQQCDRHLYSCQVVAKHNKLINHIQLE
ncbi:MAG TPA: hypothetical protein V6D15_08530 [Oculatellaceae cyanobacterium]